MSTSPGSPGQQADQNARPRRTIGLIAIVAYTVLATAVVGLGVYWLLFWTTHHDRTTGATTVSDVVRAAGLVITGLAAAAGAAVALRRQRSTEDTYQHEVAKESRRVAEVEEQSDRDRVERLRDRFTVAAGQLGDSAAAVRLAGVYAMAALADDWLDRDNDTEAQVCIDVLCAYQRTPRHLPTAEGDSAESPSTAAVDQAADTKVRETITRVVRDHLVNDADPPTWRGKNFDFSGATFEGHHNFDGAVFANGNVSFAGATFTRGTLSFAGATFGSEMTSFSGATFENELSTFEAATFQDGVTSFYNATFKGRHVSFNGAEFESGRVIFVEATLERGGVAFATATFEGARVIYDGIHLVKGEMSFDDAEFRKGVVTFNRPELTDGRFTFLMARCEGARVSGPWDAATPPEVWPPENTFGCG